MIRRSQWLRTGLVAANLLALAYPSSSAAQQPAPPPSANPAPAPAPAAPAPQAPAGYQQQPPPAGYQQQTPPAGYQQQTPPAGYQQTPPPGYQQQTPPPGYYPQQPQPGYPQQIPPPGYYPQQAQPGYPQQQPPPGYYPQQPGYYPAQPGYGPAPAPASAPVPPGPSLPAYRRGFLAMPYIGVQIPTGDSAYFGKVYDPGLRLGTFLGGHVGQLISLNGELAIDILNYKRSGDVTAVAVDMLFSPLFHFGTGMFEGFVGPKIGGFANVISMKSGSITTTYTFSGMAYGVNAGFGIPLGNVALGGLFSYTGRSPSEGCVKQTGYSESCGDYHGDDWHSVAFSGLVLF